MSAQRTEGRPVNPAARPPEGGRVVRHRIRGRVQDLGDGISVRRVLPSPGRFAIGPFVLLDHMGPLTLDGDRHFDVRPHPHIGLATLTYLWEGRVVHRDGTGVEQVIEPGAVNLMQAGSGIVHSERQHDDDRGRPLRMHGLQIWLVPPAADEAVAPSFGHVAAEDLPRLRPADGVDLRLVAGTGWGRRSPVPVRGAMVYVDARLAAGARFVVPDEHAQRALYLIDGALRIGDDERLAPGELALLEPGVAVPVTAEADTHVVLLGGAPLDRDWQIWWNFAATSASRLEAAKAGWLERRWPMVAGDAEFIPLPQPHERTPITVTGRWPESGADGAESRP